MKRYVQSPGCPVRAPAMTRRTFLGRLAGALCGASSLDFGRQTIAKSLARERLRLAAIGVGNRGLDNLSAVAAEHVVALCDVDERYLAQAHERFPQAATYRDYRELLEKVDVDGVVISTPDHSHYHATLGALKKGVHVYCEKPLAHSISEVRALTSEARRQGVVTQMGNQHHSSAGYRRVVDWLQSDILGPVREVHAWTNRPTWDQAVARPQESFAIPKELDWDLWLGPAPERSYHPSYHPFGWRGWWDFGGGALADMGPHLLDPVFWGLQLSYPRRIRAESGGGTEESAPEWSIVHFDFPARNGQPPVRLHWYDGGKQPTAEITSVKRLPSNGVMFLTERARLFAPELGGQPTVLPRDKEDRFTPPAVRTSGTDDHHQEWIQACRGAGKTSSPFEFGSLLTESCLLGNIAIRSGKELAWDPDTMSFPKQPDLSKYLSREYRAGWEAK